MWPRLDVDKQVHVCLSLGTPGLDLALCTGSCKSRWRRWITVADTTSFYAAWDVVCFLDFTCTFLTHIQFSIHKYPQVLLPRAALSLFILQSLWMWGVASTQMQEIMLGLTEFHEVCMSPLLKSVKVPWGGIPSLEQTSCNPQLGVIYRLADNVLNPTVHVTGADTKYYWSQYGPLRDTIPYWFPLRYWIIYY